MTQINFRTALTNQGQTYLRIISFVSRQVRRDFGVGADVTDIVRSIGFQRCILGSLYLLHFQACLLQRKRMRSESVL